VLKAEVYITLKKTVADPQGLTIKHALDSLGYKSLEEVRMGKMITLKLNLKDKKEADEQINQMCKKLLANPIIEDYTFKIEEE
jgi:phosphoribosylformylglycinamidine synthase subunit PurS